MNLLNNNKNNDDCSFCNLEKVPAYKRQVKIINNNKIINVSSVGLFCKIGEKYLGIKEYSKVSEDEKNEKYKSNNNFKIINNEEYKENISFIGGKIEIGQSIETALFRELKEELQNEYFARFLFNLINKETVKVYIPRCKMLVFKIKLNQKYLNKINKFLKNTGNSENCLHCGEFFQFRNIELMNFDFIKNRGDFRMTAFLNKQTELVKEIIPYFIFGVQENISEEKRIKKYLEINNNKNIIING